MGELQQEIGYFKYWKKTLKTNEADQREEWADCMHFLASLANKYGHVESMLESEYHSEEYSSKASKRHSYHTLFDTLYKVDLSDIKYYASAMASLVMIGFKLGMNYKTMEEEYFEKNQVNYDRLASGY